MRYRQPHVLFVHVIRELVILIFFSCRKFFLKKMLREREREREFITTMNGWTCMYIYFNLTDFLYKYI